MEAARGQKHPSDAENGMKESIYRKKFLSKTPERVQSDLSYNLRVESYVFWGHRGYPCCAKRAKPLGIREAGVPSVFLCWLS